uniref:RNA binding motif single stranded interacting protein 3 n=1 Tax=Molossus molossus TaxID=27622 RepID=A0A7J8DD93_MOLMO|nr:RNA binding motif single stranded interacting protein 3 [Molossus molossus]
MVFSQLLRMNISIRTKKKKERCRMLNGLIQSQDRIMILHQLLCQYMTAAAPMQGTYIPQYTPVPPTAVSIEGVVADTSPQTVAPSSQDTSGQQQQIAVDTSNEHASAYSYQQSKP